MKAANLDADAEKQGRKERRCEERDLCMVVVGVGQSGAVCRAAPAQHFARVEFCEQRLAHRIGEVVGRARVHWLVSGWLCWAACGLDVR